MDPVIVSLVLGAISIIIGVVAIVLAIVAIWYSTKSERQSLDNYNRTKDVLSEIGEKAAVIEGTVSRTQDKLVDAVTAIASPKVESQEEMMIKAILPSMLQNPEMLERFADLGKANELTRPG